MSEAHEVFRPTQLQVLAAQARAKAAARLGEPVPPWVSEVLEMAEKNGVEYPSRTA